MAKTHVIDGVTYVEVERKADIDDYVLITWFGGEIVREVRKVVRLSQFDGDFYIDTPIDNETYFDAKDDKYKTIKPLESEECCTVDTSQASPAVIEMLTALSRKIVSLEQQLRDTQRNVETWAEITESNTHYIILLDERTQVLNAVSKFYEGDAE